MWSARQISVYLYGSVIIPAATHSRRGEKTQLCMQHCEKKVICILIYFICFAFSLKKKKEVKNALYAKLELQPCGCMPPFTS